VIAMRLEVHHETEYHYAGPLAYSAQRLYLTPLSFSSQRVDSWRISAPGIDTALTYQDGFGNTVLLATAADVNGPVKVVASGVVETMDTAGIVQGLPPAAADIVFLRQTSATTPSEEIISVARAAASEVSILDRMHHLMTSIHQQVEFVTGATDSYTTAAQAFASGKGVCQDQSHILLSAARHLDIPSRYVTGYLVTGVGATSAAAHAWVEALVPGLGWVGFDAANCQCPTPEYVRVAAGIDAKSVAPIRGSRRGGGGAEEMRVEVRVEIAQQ
jgi:transglutaminase-like putative cysteine protease